MRQICPRCSGFVPEFSQPYGTTIKFCQCVPASKDPRLIKPCQYVVYYDHEKGSFFAKGILPGAPIEVIEKAAYDRLEKALNKIRNLELSTGALENEAYDICDEALGNNLREEI